MRSLNGADLAGFIKERHGRTTLSLHRSHGIKPRLVILKPVGNPVIDVFVRLKQVYADDVFITCDAYECRDEDMAARIDELNVDPTVHGIIVQLPLGDPTKTDEIVSHIDPAKDVDGLNTTSREVFTSATATAIDWLLAGYNIDLREKKLTIVGNGRLVGAPLAELWRRNGLSPIVLDDTVADLTEQLKDSAVVVTATGVPGLITSEMVMPKAVVVDAGTASENGQIVGDLAADVRERDDISVTPIKGGVGPLTIAVLFENVIKAASASVGVK